MLLPAPASSVRSALATLLLVVLLATGGAPAPWARSGIESPMDSMRDVEAAIVAAGIPELAVQYRGLDISFAHYARYKVFDSTGRRQVGPEDPVFTYLAMLFRPEMWTDTPLFPVDHPLLARQLGVPFKARLAPRQLTPTLQTRLQAIVAFATAMPEERARLLVDLPDRSRGPLTPDQFAGVFQRVLHVEARMRQVREMGLKLDVELYKQWRAEFFPPVAVPRVPWETLSPETQRPLGVLYTNYLLGRVPQDRVVNYMVLMLGNYADASALQALINDFATVGLPDHSTGQAALRLFRRVTTYHSLGEDLKLVAVPGSLSGEWLDPFEAAQLASSVGAPTRALLQALLSAFRQQDTSQLAPSTAAFLDAMRTAEGYTSDLRRRASHYYNTGHPFSTAMWFYLAGGLLLAVAAWRRSAASAAALDDALDHATGVLYGAGSTFFLIGFLFHSLGIACRVAIMERAPVSNIWESIIWVTWGGVLFGGAMEWRYRNIFTGMITALTGFAVLLSVNALPDDMGQMQPLRAVLVSTWLTYHVLAITLSYAAFLLSAAFAVCLLLRDGSLLGWAPGGATTSRLLARALPTEATLELFVYRAIQIGYPLLTWGIFSGAVWADHAWGRFWAWDPKETWSLITWFVYTAFLHMRLRHGLAGRTLAWLSLVGFAAVLITWLGVSYLPIFAGLHSYANG